VVAAFVNPNVSVGNLVPQSPSATLESAVNVKGANGRGQALG
jgi:hypothetical protein